MKLGTGQRLPWLQRYRLDQWDWRHVTACCGGFADVTLFTRQGVETCCRVSGQSNCEALSSPTQPSSLTGRGAFPSRVCLAWLAPDTSSVYR